MRLHKIIEFIRQYPLLFLSLTACLLALPLVILTDIPQRDVLSRYAPMAQAVADGDWAIAFHPRVPPLFPLLGGVAIFLFGCSAFMGVKLVSALSFILTLLPLWGIFRRVFNRRIAIWGCLFYLFCSYQLRLAASGLRECTKGFFLILTVYAVILIFQERRRLGGYIWFGIAAAAMSLTRDDSILIAALLGVFVLGLEIRKFRSFPWRTGLAAVIGLVFLSPYIWYNYCVTGFPVPGARAVTLVAGRMPQYCFGKAEFPIRPTALPPLQSGRPAEEKEAGPAGEAKVSAAVAKEADSQPLSAANQQVAVNSPKTVSITPDPEEEPGGWAFFRSLMKGIFFLFSLPGLAVAVWRIARRRWTAGESILLAIFLGHTLVMVLQVLIMDQKLYISRRYLIPAAPLTFGWTAMALFWGYRQLGRWLSFRNRKLVFSVLCVAAAGGLCYDTAIPLIKQYGKSKHALERQAVLKWAEFIRNDYSGSRRTGGHRIDIWEYHTFFLPKIACEDALALGFFSGGEGISLTPENSVLQNFPADYLAGVYRLKMEIPVFAGYEMIDRLEGYGRRYILWRRWGVGRPGSVFVR